MKNFYLCASLVALLIFAGCQKQGLSDTVVNSTHSGSLAEDAAATFAVPTKYGADIDAPPDSNSFSFEMNVAGQLGVYCLREGVTVPAKVLRPGLVPQLTTQYKVILNFSSPGKGKALIPFRTDSKQYTQDLNDVLNTFTVLPVVAVIENEESNRFFYSGSAMDYVKQLKTAIRVMHDRGIKVSNGGITDQGLRYLVYEDLLAQGKTDSAAMYQQINKVYPDSPITKNRGMFVDTLLTNYAKMNLNFVNFHWRATSPDTTSLNQTINYLRKRTGKKIFTNEIGQLDFDPNTVVTQMDLCTHQGFPYALWYSPDENEGKIGNPLQYPDATLTPSGVAYKNYLATK